MAFAGRLWTIAENMPEMSAAAAAMYFGARITDFIVSRCAHPTFDRSPEAWPTGATVKFGFGGIEAKVAASTGKYALSFLPVQWTGKSAFRSLLA